MSAVNPRRTGIVVGQMRENGRNFWADYLEEMDKCIVDVVASRDKAEKRIAELEAERNNIDALVEAAESAYTLISMAHGGSGPIARKLNAVLSRFKRATAPPQSEAETLLFVDRGDGRCKTCGHALFATDFIHEVKEANPSL